MLFLWTNVYKSKKFSILGCIRSNERKSFDLYEIFKVDKCSRRWTTTWCITVLLSVEQTLSKIQKQCGKLSKAQEPHLTAKWLFHLWRYHTTSLTSLWRNLRWLLLRIVGISSRFHHSILIRLSSELWLGHRSALIFVLFSQSVVDLLLWLDHFSRSHHTFGFIFVSRLWYVEKSMVNSEVYCLQNKA